MNYKTICFTRAYTGDGWKLSCENNRGYAVVRGTQLNYILFIEVALKHKRIYNGYANPNKYQVNTSVVIHDFFDGEGNYLYEETLLECRREIQKNHRIGWKRLNSVQVKREVGKLLSSQRLSLLSYLSENPDVIDNLYKIIGGKIK